MSDITMDCCICLETLGNTNITTTPCGHTFCFSCLMKSMDLKNTCPYCRTNLREEEDIIEESDDDESYMDMPDYQDDYEDREYNWVLDWTGAKGLDNTSNPTNTLVSVDEIMKFAEDNNITMRDMICAAFWRYDSKDNGREMEKKSRKLSKHIAKLEKERSTEWEEREGMMEEDLRRHNRISEVTYTIDREPEQII